MPRQAGKRSPEYSTRSPFLAAIESTCKRGKPNGNRGRGGSVDQIPHWAGDDPKSEGSPFLKRNGEIGDRDKYIFSRRC